jgi:hypothetical protein
MNLRLAKTLRKGVESFVARLNDWKKKREEKVSAFALERDALLVGEIRRSTSSSGKPGAGVGGSKEFMNRMLSDAAKRKERRAEFDEKIAEAMSGADPTTSSNHIKVWYKLFVFPRKKGAVVMFITAALVLIVVMVMVNMMEMMMEMMMMMMMMATGLDWRKPGTAGGRRKKVSAKRSKRGTSKSSSVSSDSSSEDY